MKKWLDDNKLWEPQQIPEEYLKLIVGEEEAKRLSPSTTNYVLTYTERNEDNFSLQVSFQTFHSQENNVWHVMVFDADDLCVGGFTFQSQTEYPPVWSRGYGMDGLDLMGIKAQLNYGLTKNGVKPFKKPIDPEKMMLYFAPQSIEEVEKLISEGKTYQIVALTMAQAEELSANAQGKDEV